MKILMVCLGNICRSPLAQGIMEKKVKDHGLDWNIDSAGTSGWHEGEHPDSRAILMANKNNVDISKQKSRQITTKDLDYFDIILTMDSQNYNDVLKICRNNLHKNKVKLLLNFKYKNSNMAVPDPYYNNNFDEVFMLLYNAMDDVINNLKSQIKKQVV